MLVGSRHLLGVVCIINTYLASIAVSVARGNTCMCAQVVTPEDEAALAQAQALLEHLVAHAPMQKRPPPEKKPRPKAQVGRPSALCMIASVLAQVFIVTESMLGGSGRITCQQQWQGCCCMNFCSGTSEHAVRYAPIQEHTQKEFFAPAWCVAEQYFWPSMKC